MSSRTFKHLDLAEMPVIEKENLCKVLDQTDSWEKLGKLMMFSEFEIAVSISRYNDLDDDETLINLTIRI